MYLFYSSYVQVTVFFLVAVLTYYFSRMIRRLEDQMKTQERLVFLGEVASNIAHELRNPLASISGSIELIVKQLGSQLNEKQRNLMQAVVDESIRVKHLFNGLLDYARVPELHTEEFLIEPFLDQVFLLMRHQEAFNPKVEIKPLYRGKQIKAHGDPEQMKQVLINVITNAFEAMEGGGCLSADAMNGRDEVTISIEDTGTGMDPKTLDLLFVPFKTNKFGGTGLGMAQAKKIVNQHGGRLMVQSKEGRGTKVEIILPKDRKSVV